MLYDEDGNLIQDPQTQDPQDSASSSDVDVVGLLRDMRNSNMGQRKLPELGVGGTLATGLASLLKRRKDPLGDIAQVTDTVQKPVMRANEQARQGFEDKLKVTNALRDEQRDAQKARLSDPNSTESLNVREAAVKKLMTSAKMLGQSIAESDIRSFVEGQSAEEIAKNDPFKLLLDVAKFSKEKEKDAKTAADKAAKEADLKSYREQQIKLGKDKLAAAESAPFRSTMDKKQADTFQKQVETLPDIENRGANLDKMLAIANKVETGPLAGNDKVYFGQKLASNDAQRLEQFLSEENVRLIMNFAKEAGVRSVDTEAEQKRLLNSIANKTLSTPVLKETLTKMKNILNQSRELIKAKQQYVEQNGNLRGFNPDAITQGKAAGGTDYTKGLKF